MGPRVNANASVCERVCVRQCGCRITEREDVGWLISPKVSLAGIRTH